MAGKLFLSSVLMSSLTCFGQVATTGGYATTAGPALPTVPVSAANAPIVATPHVALPGNGPAVGAPVSNENDSRFSSGPSVANPNVIAPASSENAASASGSANATQPENVPGSTAANTESFEFGVQEFGSASTTSRPRVTSLGEIARYYRTHRRQTVRTFNNDSIARLTNTGLPFEALGSNVTVASNASPANAAGSSTASGAIKQIPATLMAKNQPPALPQSDQDSLGVQSSRQAAPSVTAAQQRHPSEQALPVSADSSATPTTSNPQASNNTAAAPNDKPAKLPQTGTSLPLLLLLGGAGLAGGTLWLLRR